MAFFVPPKTHKAMGLMKHVNAVSINAKLRWDARLKAVFFWKFDQDETVTILIVSHVSSRSC